MVPKTDYLAQYRTAKLLAEARPQAEAEVSWMIAHKDAYFSVAYALGVPWWCVGAIHALECDGRFDRHLHNGDPLTARTVHVPKGRPLAIPARGALAYSWEESAIDALRGRWKPRAWFLNDCLHYLERYNGMGYWLRGVASPYLWAGTNVYTSGLFVADGRFDPLAISKQVGAGALFKVLEEREAVSFA